MRIIRRIKTLQKILSFGRQKGKTIGFVPTMGYLHDGHLALLIKAKSENDLCVLSIFVNPTQFGPREDFNQYPRNIKHDKTVAQRAKVDIIFLPTVDEMYPQDFLTSVTVKKLGNVLCGKFRPGHFEGVATVVAKLLNCVLPDVMYLGQKDAQQAVILQKMVKDLNFPVEVKIVPTIREKSGLAMSSRNSYLAASDKAKAAVIYRALQKAKQSIRQGERDAHVIIQNVKSTILKEMPCHFDYVACVDAQSLFPLKHLKGKVLIALALRFKDVRLIDNIVINC